MAHAFRPGLVETVRVGVRVDCDDGLGRGRTNCDLRGRVGWEPNAHVGVGIDADAFIELLVERISSLG
jgi:purine nucleosidase/pyrimidine-specific ribonucleoside hydrolase